MSTSATGLVTGMPAGANFSAVIRDLSRLLPPWDIGSAPIQPNGSFTVTYADTLAEVDVPRQIGLVVLSAIGREVVQSYRPDTFAPLNFGTIAITVADATGWEITLGKGTPQAVSDGNFVRILADNTDAWGHVADLIKGAQKSIKFMQLLYDINFFDATPPEPDIVLKFDGPPPYTAANLNNRLESLLIEASQRPTPIDSYILVPRPWFTPELLGVLLPLVLGILVWLIQTIANLFTTRSLLGDYAKVEKYFKDANATKVHVRNFDVSHFSRTHAKLFIVDDSEVVSLGSPFVQGYFDSPAHAIDNPQRGEAWHVPVHDVSLSVRGKAVAELHETFLQHWSKGRSDLPLTSITPTDPAGIKPDEFPARIQIARSLEPNMLPGFPRGEQGVLEAYLRVLEMAQDFVYFQNQYFTDEFFADALAKALVAKPNLKVMMVLPIAPDLPGYIGWQWGLVNRVRQRVEAAFPGKYDEHIEFFGRWTHEIYTLHNPIAFARPIIVRNYIHAKVALADNRWGTVGSANLDGQSLTQSQIAQVIQPVVHRNTEVNCLILPTQPPGSPEAAVDRLRRRLWAEDLGFVVGGDRNVPDLNDTRLAAPPSGGWLELFNQRADEKLQQLINSPDRVVAGSAPLLRFPNLEASLKYGRKLADSTTYLQALGGPALSSHLADDTLIVLESVYPYSFTSGKFGPELDSVFAPPPI